MKNILIFIAGLVTFNIAYASSWECIDKNFVFSCDQYRFQITDGWLVKTQIEGHWQYTNIFDPQHEWNL